MPSFDIVSEIDLHEVTNAVDQTNREVATRFDFKGSGARLDVSEGVVSLQAENDFQLEQMRAMLHPRLAKRGIDLQCLKIDPPQTNGRQARQTVTLRQGIDTPLAKQIVRLIKDSKIKVQAAIQGDQIRVTGKKRDDLQEAMALLRQQSLDMPLQFTNFRD
jgi:uncharacterized protein YajQ (UPF0234 family)